MNYPDLRRRYGDAPTLVTTPPGTQLPIYVREDKATVRRRRGRCTSLLFFMVLVAAGGGWMVLHPARTPVTLQSPGDSLGDALLPSRNITTAELGMSRVLMMPISQITRQLAGAMQRQELSCATASMLGIYVRLLAIVDAEMPRFMMNPVIVWKSQERSVIAESSPLFPKFPPTRVTRVHSIQLHYLDTAGNDHMEMLKGREAHCIQSCLALFDGKTVYHTML